jgi:hypothetical protein
MNQTVGLLDRISAPTPKFFQIIRNIGLFLGAVGAAILAVHVPLPDLFIKIAGYLVTGGAVAGAVSQMAVSNPQGGE